MNHVICFCYSMHGCCIGSEYKPPKHEKLHENNGDVSSHVLVAICNDAWLTRNGNPGNFLSGNFPL